MTRPTLKTVADNLVRDAVSTIADADLDRRIAEAMGWTWCEPYEIQYGSQTKPYGAEGAWRKPDGEYLPWYRHHPSTDIAQAWALLLSLPRYTEYRIEGSVDGREDTVLLRMTQRNIYARHPRLARAIAEAVLAAMEAEKVRAQ